MSSFSNRLNDQKILEIGCFYFRKIIFLHFDISSLITAATISYIKILYKSPVNFWEDDTWVFMWIHLWMVIVIIIKVLQLESQKTMAKIEKPNEVHSCPFLSDFRPFEMAALLLNETSPISLKKI